MQRLWDLIMESDSSEDELDYVPRSLKFLKERNNYFDTFDNKEFAIKFRLSKRATLYLFSRIKHKLEYESNRNYPISPMNQLLATLRYYATNGTQTSIGEYVGCSTITANKLVHKVSAAIAGLSRDFIKSPNSPKSICMEHEKFYKISGFPRVVGVMGCTHIRISPNTLTAEVGEDRAEMFKNNNGYHSINVQTICDSELKIIDLVARWPGSTADNTIFNNSVIKARFDAGQFGQSVLLADNVYAPSDYLLTPISDPRTPDEGLYNESLIKTRNTVDKMYRVWRHRFPVLSFGMRIKLEKILTVITATAVLHNIVCNREKVPPNEPELELPASWEELVEDGQIRQELRNDDNSFGN